MRKLTPRQQQALDDLDNARASQRFYFVVGRDQRAEMGKYYHFHEVQTLGVLKTIEDLKKFTNMMPGDVMCTEEVRIARKPQEGQTRFHTL